MTTRKDEIRMGDMVKIVASQYGTDAVTGTTWIVVEDAGQDYGLAGNAADDAELWVVKSRCQPA